MTQDIMPEWLIDLDGRMFKDIRKILHFFDNASSHPIDLKFKSMKLGFFSPNLTSLVQPLDQEITMSFNVQYGKLLLRPGRCNSQATS